MTEKKAPVNNTTEKNRSRLPLGLGLTLVIGGSLYTLYGMGTGLYLMFFSTFMDFFPSSFTVAGEVDPFKVVAMMKPLYLVQGAEKLAAGIVSIMGIIAGAGMMQYKEWGRRMGLVWAGGALLYLSVDVVLYFLVMRPAGERLFLEMSRQFASIQGGGVSVSGFMTAILPVSLQWGSVMFLLTILFMAVLPCLVGFFCFRLSREVWDKENL